MNRLVKNLTVLTLALIVISLTSCARSSKTEETARPADRIEKERDAKNSLSHQCVNLNKAVAQELMLLPGIGEVTARRIIEYRERNGPLRRKEDIIVIDGLSEKKYREIADRICVE